MNSAPARVSFKKRPKNAKIKELKNAFIIAEAGINHNGNVALARELVDAASLSGADAIKFQNFKAKRVISRFAEKAKYQKKSQADKESQLAMLEKFELKDKDYYKLYEYAGKKNIIFLSTPKDIYSVKLLEKIGISIYKIGSSEINNFEFLDFIASLRKPILLSTGMSTIEEVKAAVKVIQKKSDSSLILLHCVSQYPCPLEQVNLRAMLTLQKKFCLPVGYSDHTLGIEIVLAAVALGAKVIEKHFTLNKNMEGPDHSISLEPREFKHMVSSVRNVEKGMGDGVKKPSTCEIENIKLLRRSLVFCRNLERGIIVRSEDFTIKRPGFGLEPKYKSKLIKKRLIQDVIEDQPVQWEMFR